MHFRVELGVVGSPLDDLLNFFLVLPVVHSSVGASLLHLLLHLCLLFHEQGVVDSLLSLSELVLHLLLGGRRSLHPGVVQHFQEVWSVGGVKLHHRLNQFFEVL